MKWGKSYFIKHSRFFHPSRSFHFGDVTKYTSRRMIFSPLNRFCIDDNITILFRMNPKMKTIKKQFRWTFVVLRHMWQEPAMWWCLGCVRTQKSNNSINKTKTKPFIWCLYIHNVLLHKISYIRKNVQF